MSLTDAQRRAVAAPGSVAVTAGAGTGKTHTLGHRYLHHLREGLSPLEIVAVTFTERAAAELRARVRAYAARDLPGRVDALAEIDAAQISTLHALAARICREHPDAAGVPVDFTVLEDAEGRVWLAERFDDVTAEPPPELLAHLPFDRVRAALRSLLSDPLTAERALAVDPARWEARVVEAREAAAAELTGDPAWRDAAAAVQALRGEAGDRAEIARAEAAAGLERLAAGDARAGLERIAGVDLRGGRAAAWGPGERDAVKAGLKELRARARAARKRGLATLELGEADARLAELLPHLARAFEEARAALAAAKRRDRVLDFADLEVHALRALERAEVRDYYRARWRALLVDEFQDTNPVQEELLARLAGGLGSGALRVTVVGDEKQGIYGFRGADVAVFRRVRAAIRAGGGDDVALATSFRSHARLVTRLNALAEPLLGDLHQPLDAARATPENAAHLAAPLRALAVDPDADASDEGSVKAERLVTEARAVADALRELVEGGAEIPDPDSGEPRALRWSDVALLSRTWSPLDTYGEVLPGLGVPAVHTGGGNLLATREAKDAWALLRFLADPRDDLALAATLKSPYAAVSDRALLAFAEALPEDSGGADETDPTDDAGAGPRRRPGRAPWWPELEHADVARLDPALARARSVLADLLAERHAAPPSRLLQRAEQRTGYGAVIANLPGAARRDADRRGFRELVRELEGGLGDVFGVVRRLRRLARAEVEIPRPSIDAGDAVTLTTIHRSKGLEWPVVVVADTARRGGGARPAVRFGIDLGVALELRDPDSDEALEPAAWTLLVRDAAAREEAEARRVLYVALTRARDVAIVTAATAKAQRGSLLRLAEPGLEAAGVEPVRVPFDADEAVYPEPPPPERPQGDDGEALWRRDPAALGEVGRAARRDAARVAPGAERNDAWELAAVLLEASGSALLPVAEAAAAAGIPGPPEDGFDVELTVDGRPSGTFAPLAWRSGARRLALLDALAPAADYDQRVVRADPSDPAEAVARLRRALKRGGAP